MLSRIDLCIREFVIMYYQDVLAKCFVVMAEIDYDLQEWDKSNKEERPWGNIPDAAGGRTDGSTKES